MIKKTLIIGYEPKHAQPMQQAYRRLHDEGVEPLLLTFDAELEWLLKEESVPFVSSREYRRGERVQNLVTAEEMVREIRSQLSSMKYRGVALEAVFGFSFQVFVQKFLYFAESISMLLEDEQIEKVYVCRPYVSPNVEENTLSHYENEAMVVCVRTFCTAHSVPWEVLDAPHVEPSVPSIALKERLMRIGLAVFNSVMTVLQRRRDVRILASENWRHIGPMFDTLPHSTLVLYDRSEFFRISLKTIWRHRIRFMHPSKYLSNVSQKKVTEATASLSDAWKHQRELLLRSHNYHKIDVSPVLVEVLDAWMSHMLSEVVADIERLHIFVGDVAPQVVLLRVSMGAQAHFPILAHVAKEQGIPGIELQHGLELFAPCSLSRRHQAQYLALYGEHIRQEMSQFAPGPKFEIVGSLDFDRLYTGYVPSTLIEPPRIACIAPDIFFSAVFDSYDLLDYFEAIAKAARSIEGAHVRIKMRNSSQRQALYRGAIARAFKDMPHTIFENEPLKEFFDGATLAISCYSTAVLELLICKVPTVLIALADAEKHFIAHHFSAYEKADALRIAYDQQTLSHVVHELVTNEPTREEQVQRTSDFMVKEYAFDGHAAERLATLIQKLVRQ